MAYDKRFDALTNLSMELQREVIREAEVRLDAQLSAANAADQRAMAWAGFLITIAVASAGGSIALLTSEKHAVLSLVGLCFSANVVGASVKAMNAARPTDFCFPGSYPADWLPHEWQAFPRGDELKLKQARREQASSLHNRIAENAAWARKAGNQLALSMDMLLWAVVFWAIIGAATWLFFR